MDTQFQPEYVSISAPKKFFFLDVNVTVFLLLMQMAPTPDHRWHELVDDAPQ